MGGLTLKRFRGVRGGVLLLCAVLVACSCRGGSTRRGDAPAAHAIIPAGPITYVALGDSTGLGLGAPNGGGYVARLFRRIAQARPGSRLINASAAGATTADVLESQVGAVPDSGATLVTVCVGLNDLILDVSEQQFARNYEEIISRLRKKGALVIASDLPDVSSAPTLAKLRGEPFRRRAELFNRLIVEIVSRHRLPLVELFLASRAAIESHPGFFSSDGLHPSDRGYEFWAEKMWPVVEKAIHEGQASPRA